MATQAKTDPVQIRCAELVALFQTAPIRETFGMVLRYDDQARAVFELPFNVRLTHAIGDTHGGAIATILDNAGWFTVAPHYDFWIATTDLQVKLIEPADREDLRATGRILRIGKRLAMTDMEVRSKSGRLIAVGSGTFAVTTVPFATNR